MPKPKAVATPMPVTMGDAGSSGEFGMQKGGQFADIARSMELDQGKVEADSLNSEDHHLMALDGIEA